MNLTLLRMTFKKNALLGGIFLGVMFMYSAVMVSMFSPDSLEALNAMFKVLPPEMMKAFGFSGSFNTLVGYLASWLYGLILTAFPMVYCIILGNRLVAKTVDSGSIACLLATPNSRTRIVVTKGAYAICSIALMQMIVFGFNLLLCEALFPDEAVDVPVFFQLNLTVMLVNVTVMAITFFFSCLFNDSKRALGFGCVVPVGCLLLNMLGNASEDAQVLKACSIYGWYDPVGIANGDETLAVDLIYLSITAVLFVAGVFIFRRKRLPV